MQRGRCLLFTHAPFWPLRQGLHSTRQVLFIGGSRRICALASAPSSSEDGRRALVIVESPAKAATIQKYLPDATFSVRSCWGHVRELPSSAKRIPAKYKGEPWARLGVNVEDDFRPLYVLIEGKRKVMSELRAELASKSELILATDEDREGEAISWHLVELLKPSVPVRRAVFHEITPEAVRKGVENCRDINLSLVQAQETRRVVDRLAGYTMSPLLWKKIARGLSAGRVQSVAMALIVRRELARLRFVPSEYVSCAARFYAEGSDELREVEAALVTVDSVRLAKRTDFDGETGDLKDGTKPESLLWYTEKELKALLKKSHESPAVVTSVDRKRKSRNAPVPLITSTLQQECGNKLGMGAGRTMRAAQKLYENGFITYHRTDNPSLSEQAVVATRDAVTNLYGGEFLGNADFAEKQSSSKTPKGAQAAHEAIRPAGTEFVLPKDVTLESDERRVYELIFRRTLASQMAPAAVDTTSVLLETTLESGKVLRFKANGSVIVFPGHLLATKGIEAENTSSQFLPAVDEGEEFCMDPAIVTVHSTKPPARYNDASIVKELEELGVGRPSTYAIIIEKLIERGYAYRGRVLGEHKGVPRQALVPSLTAFAVERLLSTHFPSFVDAEFTARMEATLDQIAAGAADRAEYLSSYYSGEKGLAASVERTEKDINPATFRRIVLPNLPPGMCDEDEDRKGKKKSSAAKKRPRASGKSAAKPSSPSSEDWSSTRLLVNSYGPYLEREGRVVAGLPKSTLAEELNADRLEQVIRIAQDPPTIGPHPRTGEPILLKTSSYGPYVQLGYDADYKPGEKPKRSSLLPGMDAADVNAEVAARLLELPRVVGVHPGDGEEIRATRGPYGPYIAHAGASVSLRGGATDVLDIGLEECVRLLDEAAERKRLREEKQAAKAAANLDAAKKSKAVLKANTGKTKHRSSSPASAKAKRAPKSKKASLQ